MKCTGVLFISGSDIEAWHCAQREGGRREGGKETEQLKLGTVSKVNAKLHALHSAEWNV